MTARVLSVNIGRLSPPAGGRGKPTAIDKQPTAQAEVRAPGPKKGGLGSGLVGDQIGNAKHHGGDRQAVYAFAREELNWWQSELGRDLPDGLFGENLTTDGLDVDAALLGERWRIGAEVVLEVTGPRVPCATFAAQMGEPGWVRRFTQRGRTGAYLAVITPGVIRAGDPIERLSRPEHDIEVPRSFRAYLGQDDEAARSILDLGYFAESDRERLRTHLEGAQ